MKRITREWATVCVFDRHLPPKLRVAAGAPITLLNGAGTQNYGPISCPMNLDPAARCGTAKSSLTKRSPGPSARVSAATAENSGFPFIKHSDNIFWRNFRLNIVHTRQNISSVLPQDVDHSSDLFTYLPWGSER